MEPATWLLFAGIALVCTLSPGPAVLLAVSNSLAYGFGKAVFSSLGNITGIFFVAGAAVLGLGAILQTSQLLFSVLKIAGAIYLVYLGLRQWRATHNIFNSLPADAHRPRTRWNAFVQGMLVAVSNPKAALFFTAFFPQFINLSRPVAVQFLILTITFMLFSFLCLVGYALGAHCVRRWFNQGRRALWFNRTAGAIFIAFGLGMLRVRNRSV
jgi:homoserine/homoserine lactone efflux protein